MNCREFKLMTNYTYEKIAAIVGCVFSTIHANAINGTELRDVEHRKRLAEIYEAERLIRTDPGDKILLVYELENKYGYKYMEIE